MKFVLYLLNDGFPRLRIVGSLSDGGAQVHERCPIYVYLDPQYMSNISKGGWGEIPKLSLHP